jgi:hypothetical protein
MEKNLCVDKQMVPFTGYLSTIHNMSRLNPALGVSKSLVFVEKAEWLMTS